MQCIAVRIGIDSDSLDTHFARRLDNPAGNFATVGDQNLLEHMIAPLKRNVVVFLPRIFEFLVA